MFYSLYYVRIPEICGCLPSMGTCCATYFGVSVLTKKGKTILLQFDVHTGRPYSRINKVLGTSIEVEYVKNPIKNYVQDTLADTSKSEKELGFKANFTLEQGLKEITS